MISSADSKHAVPLSALCPRHRLQPVAVLPGGLLLSGSYCLEAVTSAQVPVAEGPTSAGFAPVPSESLTDLSSASTLDCRAPWLYRQRGIVRVR